jgi:transposase-like protein
MARGRRDVEKEQFWRLAVEEQQRSGLGVREFCRRESVSEPSFYAWRRELRRRDGDARQASPRQTRQARQAAKHARKLVPVEVVDRSKVHPRAQQGAAMQAIEIVTPGGWRLRLAADIEPARLRAVLDVVAGRESAGPADARTERAPC